MVLPFKKQAAKIVCFSLISSYMWSMDKTVGQWKNPTQVQIAQINNQEEGTAQPGQATAKPKHHRTTPLAGPSVFNCNPCCNNQEQDSPQRRSQEPTRIHVEEIVQSMHESHPSRELTSLSFATANDFKERESAASVGTQSSKGLPTKNSVSIHLDEMDKLEKEDSCMQRALASTKGKLAKISDFNRTYKINYILGALELSSAFLSIYNIASNTNPEPEWEHVVNTMAAVSCVQGGLAQITAGSINTLTGKTQNQVHSNNKNSASKPSGLTRVGNFCYENAGLITTGLGATVAATNLAFPGDTPAAVNGIDAVVSLTGVGACVVAESLSRAKEKIVAQQKAERERRHGSNDSVELDGRRITFSNVSTRTTESSDASSAASTARSESQPGEMLV